MRTLIASILAIAMFLWFVPAVLQRLVWHRGERGKPTPRVETQDRGGSRGHPPRGARPPREHPRTVDL